MSDVIEEFGEYRMRGRSFWIGLSVFLVLILLAVGIARCSAPAAYQPAVMAQAPAVIAAPAQVAAAPAPVVVQQPSNDGFFTGLMMGHFLSGGSSHTVVAAPPTVVNRTVVNKTVVVNRAPVAAVIPPAPRAPSVIPRPAPYAPPAPRTSFSTVQAYRYSPPRVTYSAPSYSYRRR
jgi:hypothetical protein